MWSRVSERLADRRRARRRRGRRAGRTTSPGRSGPASRGRWPRSGAAPGDRERRQRGAGAPGDRWRPSRRAARRRGPSAGGGATRRRRGRRRPAARPGCRPPAGSVVPELPQSRMPAGSREAAPRPARRPGSRPRAHRRRAARRSLPGRPRRPAVARTSRPSPAPVIRLSPVGEQREEERPVADRLVAGQPQLAAQPRRRRGRRRGPRRRAATAVAQRFEPRERRAIAAPRGAWSGADLRVDRPHGGHERRANCSSVTRLVAVGERLLGPRVDLDEERRRRRSRRPRATSGVTSQRLPVACDGSITTGRWVSSCSSGTAVMSSVLRV